MKRPILPVILIIILFFLWPSTACMEQEYGPDTTSHDFEWTIDTIGSYGYLNDVAIINENNIWVVGEFYTSDPDSSWDGTGWERFTAAQWNGKSWHYKQIHSNAILNRIKIFSENDMWVSSGFPKHWDGNEWQMYHLQDMGLGATVGRGIWGTSSENLYFIGIDGNIVSYNNDTFQQMSSGTDINLNDIYGSGESVIATGYNIAGDKSGHSIVLEYNGSKWETIYTAKSIFPDTNIKDFGRIYSVWAYENNFYLSTKAGIWKKPPKKIGRILSGSEFTARGRTIRRIRGNSENDLLLASVWGEFIHFSGKTWNIDLGVYNKYPNGQIIIRGMAYDGSVVAAVGYIGNKATVLRGQRKH